MPSDAIKIVIEAEDKASAQAMSASKNIEQSIRGVKETSQKAKASTEFIGILAGQLGGSQFQQAAQGLAAVTEKVGQFSEVSKAGSAGVLAFQAGLVLLATTVSFNVGKSIGEAIFGVRELKDEFGEAKDQIEGFTQAMIAASEKGFKEKLEDLSLIKDPVKQQNEAAAAFDAIQAAINEAYDNFHYRQQQLEKLRGETDILGNNKDAIAMLELENEQYNATIANLEKQKWALSDLYGERANNIKSIKEQQADEDAAAAKKKQIDDKVLGSLKAANYKYIELTKSIEESRLQQLKDEGVTDADAKRILFAERLAREAQATADVKKKADEDEKARIQKIEELRKSELARLEEQKVLLSQGEEAAHSFRLQQQGLAKEQADRIAAEQAGIDRLKKTKELEKKIQDKPSLVTVESRLLSKGPSEDTQKSIADNTMRTVEGLEKIREAIAAQKKQDNNPNVTFEVVA